MIYKEICSETGKNLKLLLKEIVDGLLKRKYYPEKVEN